MSRSYRKQPVWKDHNRGMKAMANRKVRRALNRDANFELPNSLYKRYFCQYDICDYTRKEVYKDWLNYRGK